MCLVTYLQEPCSHTPPGTPTRQDQPSQRPPPMLSVSVSVFTHLPSVAFPSPGGSACFYWAVSVTQTATPLPGSPRQRFWLCPVVYGRKGKEKTEYTQTEKDLRKVRKQKREAQGTKDSWNKGRGPRNQHTHRDSRKHGKGNLETIIYVFGIVNEVMRPNCYTQKICNRYYHILQAVPKGNLEIVICTENRGK